MCNAHPRSSRRVGGAPSRRDVLRFAAAGMGLAALGPFRPGRLPEAHGAPTGNPIFVVVNMYGGNDGLNMVVPVTLQPYYDRRNLGQPGSIAIPPGSELSLTGGPNPTSDYGLHPALVNLQSMWNDGDVAIVNKVGYPTANLSHFTSQDIYSLGVRGAFAPLGIDESGWGARFADLYAPTPMGAVSVGVGRPLDFVGGTSNPFMVASLANFQFLEDEAYPDNHLHRLQAVKSVLQSYGGTGIDAGIADALEQGHDLADQIQTAVEAYSSNVTYGNQNVQRYLRDIAMLVQYGFETQVFYTGFGGFDTHANQGAGTGNHANLLTRMDTGLAAFAQDMKDMGIWDHVVILIISEFGRRNYQNGSTGTDHGHGNVFIALGGAVNGGAYGSGLTEGDLLLEYPPYEIDFRDLYREILQDHLGADPAPVFPESQPTSHVLGIV
jgi:uncharacterized protein (DUF1501 family)